ncbi:MAG: tRNA modifying enzyme, partial [Halobacteriales archaeon]|nr:tRNA modifying enzyme [Halobacteriales archaeon]
GTDAAAMKGLGGPTKKARSKELTDVKMDVVGAHYEAMVGEQRSALVVQPGTGDSVKCRDDAYRQIVIPDAASYGITPGEFLDVRVTGHETVYAVGRPA